MGVACNPKEELKVIIALIPYIRDLLRDLLDFLCRCEYHGYNELHAAQSYAHLLIRKSHLIQWGFFSRRKREKRETLHGFNICLCRQSGTRRQHCNARMILCWQQLRTKQVHRRKPKFISVWVKNLYIQF